MGKLRWATGKRNAGFNRPTTRLAFEADAKPQPFFQWMGGKRKFLAVLLGYMPTSYRRYYEPFLGGGALFFELRARGLPAANCEINDTNFEIIVAYRVVRDDVVGLIGKLQDHASRHSREFHRQMCKPIPGASDLEVAARFIYLMQTGYKGMYSVDGSGIRNEGFGDNKATLSKDLAPTIVNPGRLLACSKALRGVRIRCGDYADMIASEGDFAYLDPPYEGVYKGIYGNYSFDETRQTELRDFCLALSDRGVKILQSNNDTESVRELYGNAPFTIHLLDVAQNFYTSNKGATQRAREVVITNYG